MSSAVLMAGTLVSLDQVQAQSPPATPPAQTSAQVGELPQPRRSQTAVRPTQYSSRRRSIVHHYPYPYPNYYVGDRSGGYRNPGYRNPGGAGRYSEYYPPGNQFQNQQQGADPVRVARFGEGGGPTLADQRAAQQIGIQRANSMQNHIDNYARPFYGYGFGVGFFGGFN